MKLSHGRHGSDTVSSKLSELLAARGVDVDETIHVAYAETMDGVWGMALPLSSEARAG